MDGICKPQTVVETFEFTYVQLRKRAFSHPPTDRARLPAASSSPPRDEWPSRRRSRSGTSQPMSSRRMSCCMRPR
jgi:hypothetical protein